MTENSPVRLVDLDVNDTHHSLAVEPRRPLVETLRDDIGLTGTKVGCEMGNCGACTVLIDDRAVYSCLVLTVECDGRRIETIESLADADELGPVQTAFVDADALQCGFCTPGQIMSAEAIRRRVESGDAIGRDEITHEMAGNLCRCGAYRHILEATAVAVGARAGGAS